MVEELTEHRRHHRVATVHVADVLVDNHRNETRRRKRLTSDGTPARPGDRVVVSGSQQTIERRQGFAERRVAQIVAPAAEFAERGRVVARKRLLVVAANVRSCGRLYETGDVHIVESLRQRTSQSTE